MLAKFLILPVPVALPVSISVFIDLKNAFLGFQGSLKLALWFSCENVTNSKTDGHFRINRNYDFKIKTFKNVKNNYLLASGTNSKISSVRAKESPQNASFNELSVSVP